jgi:biopolymer transport protein TolR
MAQHSSLRSGRKRSFKSEINVVPYIDVMLVLLIIFMAVPANEMPSVVNLPSAEKSALPPSTYIQISIRPENRLSIGVGGAQKIPFEDVADRAALLERLRALHEEYPDYPVLIAGDRDSKYDDVIRLISEAKKMGINRVGLATK